MNDKILVKFVLVATYVGLGLSCILTRIDYVPPSTSLDVWIPLWYWLLLGTAILTLCVTMTYEAYQHLRIYALFAVFTSIFVVFGISEVYPRAYDTYSFEWAVQFVGNTANHPPSPPLGYLLSWPGYFYFIDAFRQITGLSYYATPKVLMVFVQASVLLLSLALGIKIFGSRKFGLITAAVVLAFLPWVADHIAPVELGAVYLVLATYGLIRPVNSGARLVYLIGFAAAAITHGLTAFILLVAVTASILSSRTVLRHGSTSSHSLGQPVRRTALSNPASLVYICSALIFAFWGIVTPFLAGNLTSSLSQFLSLGTTPATYQFGYLTMYRYPSVLAAAIYVILLAGFVTYLLFLRTRGKSLFSLEPLVICAFVMLVMYFFPLTSSDLADRLFEASFPFAGWFIAHSIIHTKNGKYLVLSFSILGLLLLSGFTYYYSHESVMIFPQTEVQGDSFYVHYAPTNLALGYFSAAPYPWMMVDSPTQAVSYFQVDYAVQSPTRFLPEVDIIINSLMVKNTLLYLTGTDNLTSYVETHGFAMVYNSGAYAIYLRST